MGDTVPLEVALLQLFVLLYAVPFGVTCFVWVFGPEPMAGLAKKMLMKMVTFFYLQAFVLMCSYGVFGEPDDRWVPSRLGQVGVGIIVAFSVIGPAFLVLDRFKPYRGPWDRGLAELSAKLIRGRDKLGTWLANFFENVILLAKGLAVLVFIVWLVKTIWYAV